MTPIQKEYRNFILEGKLPLPSKFVEIVGSEYEEPMNLMWNSLWFNYVRNKGSISIPYYYDKFDNRKAFNRFLLILSKSKWVTSEVIPARHWAEARLNEDKLLQLVTPDELQDVRAKYKFRRYLLTDKTDTVPNRTRLGNKITDTGLVRKGFAKLSSTAFQYDIDTLIKHRDVIQLNLTKGIDKVAEKYPDMRRDKADYGTISTTILDYHINSKDRFFTSEGNINDTRGRAIKESLKKVFNPIGYKDARALLVIPKGKRKIMTEKALSAVYLFIAELLGFKQSTIGAKLMKGVSAYNNRTLPNLDPTDEGDRKDWHELIWLERLYDELNNYNKSTKPYYWSVPIELDASALA